MLFKFLIVIIIFCIIIFFGTKFCINIYDRFKKDTIESKLTEYIDNSGSIDANLFLEFRKEKNPMVSQFSAPGVYVIKNTNTGSYYVGQSVNIVNRVNHHLTGHGNPDVYFDFRNGDPFKVTLLLLSNTNFVDLNQFEKNVISATDSYYNGYNKTRGNSTRN